MALTQPFINTLPSFASEKGCKFYINVLGGETITAYGFTVRDNDTNAIIDGIGGEIAVQQDIESKSIRQFLCTIPPAKLINNKTYKIRPYTKKNETIIEGDEALVTCYATPNVNIFFADFDNSSQENPTVQKLLTDYSVIPSINPEFTIEFDAIDRNSIAKPNSASFTLYGIDKGGNKNLISKSGNLYNFSHDVTTNKYSKTFTMSGFTLNTTNPEGTDISPDALFIYFILEYELFTIENFSIKKEFKNLKCFYNVLSFAPYLNIYNICDKGVIKINCDGLQALVGDTNQEPPKFIGGEEIDLSTNGDYVRWQKQFIVQQPYTIRFWCRDLQPGMIAKLYLSSDSGMFIEMKYNESAQDNKCFISLRAIMMQIPFQKVGLNYNEDFGIYIESQRINKSLINENTELFIGVKQQAKFFDLDFQIIDD